MCRPLLYPDSTSIGSKALGLAGLGITNAAPLPGEAQAHGKAQKRSDTAAANYQRLLSRYGGAPPLAP